MFDNFNFGKSKYTGVIVFHKNMKGAKVRRSFSFTDNWNEEVKVFEWSFLWGGNLP